MTTQRPKPPQIDVLLPSVGVATVPPQPSYPGRQRKPRVPRILQHAMPPIKEADVLRQVRDYLRIKGWLVYRHQAGLGAPKGFPDLVAVGKGGMVWFIEVKTPTGTLSSYQREFWDEVSSRGCVYLVVRCVEDIIAAVKGAEEL